MFGRIFIAQLKIGLRNKSNIFWCLLFPIILGTLFYAAFGTLYEKTKIESIKTAVCCEDMETGERNDFTEVLEGLSYEDDQKMLDITYVNEIEARKMLDEGNVDGVITAKSLEDITLLVSENGLNQSILSSIISQYHQTVSIITETVKKNPEKVGMVIEKFQKGISCTVDEKISDGNMDPYVAYFYNLIAMVCMFAALMGLMIPVSSQANLSCVGARLNVAPVSKLISEVAALLAQYLIQLFVAYIALIYLIFVLGINFGDKIPLIFATTTAGTFLGISLGFFVGHLGKAGKNTKEGILTSIIMTGCFLSGLMFAQMKVIVQEHCPIVNKINLVAVLTDSFYSLNIYGIGIRYYTDMLIMIGSSLVFILVGVVLARRSRYASL